MSKIGYLNKNGEELYGEVNTIQLQLSIKLTPIRNKQSAQAPDFIILTKAPSGADVEIGNAWKKTKQQIGDVILEFLSITIDDPSLPNALNVAAFPNNTNGYDITWRRRQPKTNEAA